MQAATPSSRLVTPITRYDGTTCQACAAAAIVGICMCMCSPATVPDAFNLKPVARQVLRVSRVAMGVAEYVGATFDDEHFGLCVCGVFSYLAGFTPTPDAQA